MTFHKDDASVPANRVFCHVCRLLVLMAGSLLLPVDDHSSKMPCYCRSRPSRHRQSSALSCWTPANHTMLIDSSLMSIRACSYKIQLLIRILSPASNFECMLLSALNVVLYSSFSHALLYGSKWHRAGSDSSFQVHDRHPRCHLLWTWTKPSRGLPSKQIQPRWRQQFRCACVFRSSREQALASFKDTSFQLFCTSLILMTSICLIKWICTHASRQPPRGRTRDRLKLEDQQPRGPHCRLLSHPCRLERPLLGHNSRPAAFQQQAELQLFQSHQQTASRAGLLERHHPCPPRLRWFFMAGILQAIAE